MGERSESRRRKSHWGLTQVLIVFFSWFFFAWLAAPKLVTPPWVGETVVVVVTQVVVEKALGLGRMETLAGAQESSIPCTVPVGPCSTVLTLFCRTR